jgi:hypothetical protein
LANDDGSISLDRLSVLDIDDMENLRSFSGLEDSGMAGGSRVSCGNSTPLNGPVSTLMGGEGTNPISMYAYMIPV